MTAGSGPNGGCYERAGGHKPAFRWEPMTARDPAAELDPAGADDDPIARRRRALGLGILLIVLSLGCFAYSLNSLMSGLGAPR